MKKYVIITDSCCDLNAEMRARYGVEYVPMHFNCEGKEYVADLDWKELSAQDFYDMMRAGKRFLTAQVTAAQYTEAFEKYILEGYDVLSISCSSALSASVKVSYAVRDELKEKYPEAKIYCIDALNACAGLGMICVMASELRAQGKSIEETAAWIEENKLKVNQECTVESLAYLKKAGRVSAASAFFGGLLSVKPIIISDAKGQNFALEKVKGRQTSLERVADRTFADYGDSTYQKIFIAHADCENDAEKLKELLLTRFAGKNMEVTMGYIGPIVGATVGPGTLGVYVYGNEVTVNKE
ncbi:MAG: DegV family protein [Clostridia bacterium]|nr:DegV family protein [Clostridia bacterium]